MMLMCLEWRSPRQQCPLSYFAPEFEGRGDQMQFILITSLLDSPLAQGGPSKPDVDTPAGPRLGQVDGLAGEWLHKEAAVLWRRGALALGF